MHRFGLACCGRYSGKCGQKLRPVRRTPEDAAVERDAHQPMVFTNGTRGKIAIEEGPNKCMILLRIANKTGYQTRRQTVCFDISEQEKDRNSLRSAILCQTQVGLPKRELWNRSKTVGCQTER